MIFCHKKGCDMPSQFNLNGRKQKFGQCPGNGSRKQRPKVMKEKTWKIRFFVLWHGVRRSYVCACVWVCRVRFDQQTRRAHAGKWPECCSAHLRGIRDSRVCLWTEINLHPDMPNSTKWTGINNECNDVPGSRKALAHNWRAEINRK